MEKRIREKERRRAVQISAKIKDDNIKAMEDTIVRLERENRRLRKELDKRNTLESLYRDLDGMPENEDDNEIFTQKLKLEKYKTCSTNISRLLQQSPKVIKSLIGLHKETFEIVKGYCHDYWMSQTQRGTIRDEQCKLDERPTVV